MTYVLRPFFLAALFLTGCASANVEVAVDVYGTDVLSFRRLEVADAQALLEGIDNSVQAAHEIADARLQLAKGLIDAYEAYTKVFITARGDKYKGPPEDIANLRNIHLPSYDKALRAKEKDISTLASNVRERITGYLERAYVGVAKTPQQRLDLIAAEGQVILATGKLRTQLQRIGEDLETDFEIACKRLIDVAPGDLEKLAKVQDKNLNDEAKTAIKELKDRFIALARTIEDLKGRGLRVGKELGNAMTSVAAKIDPSKSGAVLEDAKAIAGTLFAITPSTGLNDRGEFAFAQLGRALDLYVSQIDRLQDPADPAWRELLRPENEINWAPFFARTSYRAEGDTGVVIARDRLGHFRVQRARNNPSALIQGQLRISRAIASGLADALGAATGVPGVGAAAGAAKAALPKADGTKSETPKTDAAAEAAKPDTTTQAAKLDAQARLRHSARANLINNLEFLNRDLKELKDSKTPVPADLLIKARAVLEGTKPVFDSKKE